MISGPLLKDAVPASTPAEVVGELSTFGWGRQTPFRPPHADNDEVRQLKGLMGVFVSDCASLGVTAPPDSPFFAKFLDKTDKMLCWRKTADGGGSCHGDSGGSPSYCTCCMLLFSRTLLRIPPEAHACGGICMS